MTLENPPKKIDDWYEWATKLNHQWRRMQKIMGRTQTNHPKTSTSNKQFFSRKERDSNAMDIDAMSFDKRKKLMQDGKCLLQMTWTYFKGMPFEERIVLCRAGPK